MKRAVDEVVAEEVQPESGEPEMKKAKVEDDRYALLVEDSYRRLLASIPPWVKDQAFCFDGKIDWERWLVGIRGCDWLAPALAAASPRGLDKLSEMGVWLQYFIRAHAERHYGSYELQVLLFILVNHGSLTDADLSLVYEATAALVTGNEEEEAIWRAVEAILDNREQVLLFRFSPAGITAELRYHSLLHDHPAAVAARK